MNCPRCSASLEERSWVSATVDICRACGGVWLDRGELDRIIASEHDQGRAGRGRGRDDNDDDDDGDDGDRDDGPRRRTPVRDDEPDPRRGARGRGDGDDDDRQGGWLSRLSQLFD